MAMASLMVMSVMSRPLKNGDAAPLLLVHHVDGVQAVALAEQAIVGRGNAAALGVAQIDGAGLEAGLLLDQVGQRLADAGRRAWPNESTWAEPMTWPNFGQMAALGHHDDAVVLAVIVVVLQQRADVVDVDLLLGNQNHVRAAGDARGIGDPAGIAAHHFNDNDAVVRVGGGVDAVDRPRWRS